MPKNKEVSKIKEIEFTKEQIVNSKKYIKYRDLLNAILKNEEKYTLKDIDKKIEKFMKGKVM